MNLTNNDITQHKTLYKIENKILDETQINVPFIFILLLELYYDSK